MPYKGYIRRTPAQRLRIGEPIDVAVQDQTTEILDLYLSASVQSVAIATNTSIDDTVVTITSGVQPTNGNILCFKEGIAFYQGTILSSAANASNWDVTLDTPLDYAYTTAGGCSERNPNMAVNGSVTPVEFSVSPSGLRSDLEWDVVRITGTMLDSTSMDDGKFGGLTALTNGIVVRVEDGTTKNIFNAKTNGDIALRMYDGQYADKAPAGQYGYRFRRTFGGQSKNGVVIRLSAEDSDELKIIVQDDLTGLDSFLVVAQGHIVNP